MTGRDRTAFFAVAAAALIAVVWFALLSPRRDEAAKLGSQLSDARKTLTQANQEVAAGMAARAGYAASYQNVARLGEAVPTDDNVPSLIVQIQGAARSAGITFRSLVVQPGSGGAVAPAPAAAASSSSSTSSSSSGSGSNGSNGSSGSSGSGSSSSSSSSTPASSSSSSSSSSSTTSAPATQAAATALPPGASLGPAGFPVMPFTFTFDGSFFKLADFFHRLQAFVSATNKRIAISGRLMTLDGIAFGAGTGGFPNISATVAATTFLEPADEGLTNGATSTGPSGTAGAAGSASGAPTVAAAAGVAR